MYLVQVMDLSLLSLWRGWGGGGLGGWVDPYPEDKMIDKKYMYQNSPPWCKKNI